MYEFGAYGLPGRFSHWTHGQAYHQMKTMYDYGLTKIYELVINTNPCYAFLLEANSLLQNKLVVAHVLAHCDFFRHNAYFQRTNRQMLETVSVNAERIRRYEFEHGTRRGRALPGRGAVDRGARRPLDLPRHRDRTPEDDKQKPAAPPQHALRRPVRPRAGRDAAPDRPPPDRRRSASPPSRSATCCAS